MSGAEGGSMTAGRGGVTGNVSPVSGTPPVTVRPCDNPFRVGRLDALGFVEHVVGVDAVVQALAKNNYRGALVGGHGTGKSTLLRAVGDRLIGRGLSPMPLFMNTEERGRLPLRWRIAVRRAGEGDALLLDGYDHLPRWARLWVRYKAQYAGALVVTSHRRCRLRTVAQMQTSPALLRTIVAELAGEGYAASVDCEALWQETGGNLRDALRLLYDRVSSEMP